MTLSCSLLCTKGKGYSLAGQLTLSVPLFTTRLPCCSSVTAHSQSKAIRPCWPPCGTCFCVCVCVAHAWGTNDIAYALNLNWSELEWCKCTLIFEMCVLWPRSHSGQCSATCSPLCRQSWCSALWQTFSLYSLWDCLLFICMQHTLHWQTN